MCGRTVSEKVISRILGKSFEEESEEESEG